MRYGDLVSVIVPLHNRAHLLRRSVGSLISQSYRNLEILLIDDCSTDDPAAVVAALDDPRVKLIRRERNGGASAARNTGIALAKGEMIAFHDSDDICVFDKIEKQVEALTALSEEYIGVYTVALFYGQAEEADYAAITSHLRPTPGSSPLSGDMYRRTVAGNAMNLPTMLLRRSAVEAAGGLDERLGNNNDWDLALRLTRLGKFHFIPEPLYLVPSPIRAAGNAGRISKSQKFHAKSFAFVTGKLRRGGERSPELAGHYSTAGGLLLRERRPRFARRYLRAALGITPLHMRSLRLYAMSFLPGLYPALRRIRSRVSPR